jgi:HPr kinase/phosphorylase
MTSHAPVLNLHATCVSVNGQGILITGASGAGKSAFALQLMALGAQLVSDDRTNIWRDDRTLWAAAPDALLGLIEARGIGILRGQPAKPAPIALLIDMDRCETERMPPDRTICLHEIEIPCLYKIDAAYFPAAVLQYVRCGRLET